MSLDYKKLLVMALVVALLVTGCRSKDYSDTVKVEDKQQEKSSADVEKITTIEEDVAKGLSDAFSPVKEADDVANKLGQHFSTEYKYLATQLVNECKAMSENGYRLIRIDSARYDNKIHVNMKISNKEYLVTFNVKDEKITGYESFVYSNKY